MKSLSSEVFPKSVSSVMERAFVSVLVMAAALGSVDGHCPVRQGCNSIDNHIWIFETYQNFIIPTTEVVPKLDPKPVPNPHPNPKCLLNCTPAALDAGSRPRNAVSAEHGRRVLPDPQRQPGALRAGGALHRQPQGKIRRAKCNEIQSGWCICGGDERINSKLNQISQMHSTLSRIASSTLL